MNKYDLNESECILADAFGLRTEVRTLTGIPVSAVRAYRDRVGCGIKHAHAAVERYLASKDLRSQPDAALTTTKGRIREAILQVLEDQAAPFIRDGEVLSSHSPEHRQRLEFTADAIVSRIASACKENACKEPSEDGALEEYARTPDEELKFAEEAAMAQTALAVAGLLADTNTPQRALAERIGVAQARISQILCADSNPTVRTMARIGHAMGRRMVINFFVRCASLDVK